MSTQLNPKEIYQALLKIKLNSPLIHNISNYVSMNVIANVLLSIGASPVMAHAIEELDDITNIATAIVLNIGTLDNAWLQSIEKTQVLALRKQLPIIFDPVGSGASFYRTESALNILERGVQIVRGNASEIRALTGSDKTTKGVDSLYASDEAVDAAKKLSKKYGCVVIISGQEDIICHNNTLFYLRHGDALLTKITGMGCAVTAVVGAFSAVVNDPLLASVYAMLSFNISAEKAIKNAKGPGSLYVELLDTLYNLTETDFDTLNYSVIDHEKS